MENKSHQPENNWGKQLLTWQIPAHQQHERKTGWYIIFGLIVVGFLFLSFITPNMAFSEPNYLFAIMVLLVVFIFIANIFREPQIFDVLVTTEGVAIGERLYDYDELKNFCVLYKPKDNVATLYLEFKNIFRPRLSIPLFKQNPLHLREVLLRYLTEDLERTEESNTDFLSKILKI